jgi:hypothetical protein
MYNAETHAVRAYFVDRIPKKTTKKPHAGMMYLFSTQVVSLYQKGHSEKKTIVSLKNLRNVEVEPSGTQIVISYTDGKKEKTMRHKFRDVTETKAFLVVLDR